MSDLSRRVDEHGSHAPGERGVYTDDPRSGIAFAIEPTRVLAVTLKRLYPQNPDVVLGREARLIMEAFAAQGYAVVLTGCAHDFDYECARCVTLRDFQPWELG